MPNPKLLSGACALESRPPRSLSTHAHRPAQYRSRLAGCRAGHRVGPGVVFLFLKWMPFSKWRRTPEAGPCSAPRPMAPPRSPHPALHAAEGQPEPDPEGLPRTRQRLQMCREMSEKPADGGPVELHGLGPSQGFVSVHRRPGQGRPSLLSTQLPGTMARGVARHRTGRGGDGREGATCGFTMAPASLPPGCGCVQLPRRPTPK